MLSWYLSIAYSIVCLETEFSNTFQLYGRFLTNKPQNIILECGYAQIYKIFKSILKSDVVIFSFLVFWVVIQSVFNCKILSLVY